MASVSQHCCISALNCGRNGNTSAPKRKPNPNFFVSTKFSSFTLKSLGTNAESSQPSPFYPSESPVEAEVAGNDPVKAAFSRAKEYKKSILSSSEPTSSPMTDKVTDGVDCSNNLEETEVLPGLEGGTEGILRGGRTESSPPSSSITSKSPPYAEPEDKDRVKAAFARARAYKDSIRSSHQSEVSRRAVKDSEKNDTNGSDDSIYGLENAKFVVEKEKEHMEKENEMIDVTDRSKNSEETKKSPGLKRGTEGISRDVYIGNKEEVTVSKLDFMGLNFSDEKKRRGLPAGLVPLNDPFPQGDLPEVEFIAGDRSKFETLMPLVPDPVVEDKSDLYKPKVSTWGVFPRPGNISKTFGGGRVIHPGEVLETADDKAVKEAQTRKLISAYRDKVGLNCDPRLRLEAEKALNDGNILMDLGKLKDALPYYGKVMDKLAFQSELHGLAALQWSICQDSLNRPNEARAMYDRLQSHPNIEVRKKAKQFIFGFKAMEIMKIKSSSASAKNTVYENYFNTFVGDKANYPITEAESEEGALTQALPYIIFLVSPIFIVVLLAVNMGT